MLNLEMINGSYNFFSCFQKLYLSFLDKKTKYHYTILVKYIYPSSVAISHCVGQKN